jgi:hypothetical protein
VASLSSRQILGARTLEEKGHLQQRNVELRDECDTLREERDAANKVAHLRCEEVKALETENRALTVRYETMMMRLMLMLMMMMTMVMVLTWEQAQVIAFRHDMAHGRKQATKIDKENDSLRAGKKLAEVRGAIDAVMMIMIQEVMVIVVMVRMTMVLLGGDAGTDHIGQPPRREQLAPRGTRGSEEGEVDARGTWGSW